MTARTQKKTARLGMVLLTITSEAVDAGDSLTAQRLADVAVQLDVSRAKKPAARIVKNRAGKLRTKRLPLDRALAAAARDLSTCLWKHRRAVILVEAVDAAPTPRAARRRASNAP